MSWVWPEKKGRAVAAEWTTAAFTIFWSVWWGAFVGEINNLPIIRITFFFPNLDSFDLMPYQYLAANVILVGVYSITYGLWLSKALKTTYAPVSLADFLGFSTNYLITLSLLLSSITLVLYSVPQISYALLNYGIFLTLMWPLVIMIILWPNQ